MQQKRRGLFGAIACVLLAAGALVSHGSPPTGEAARSPKHAAGGADGRSNLPTDRQRRKQQRRQKTNAADVAFQKENWREARTLYAADLKAMKNWHSPRAQRAVERSVLCSIKLQDWNTALDLVEKARDWKPDVKLDKAVGNWNSISFMSDWEANLEQERQRRKKKLAHLEFCRRLLRHMADNASQAPAEFRQRLVTSQIVGNFRLVTFLDPQTADEVWVNYGDRVSRMQWWWKDPRTDRLLPGAGLRLSDEFSYSNNELPVGKDGRPIFLKPPARYSQARCSGEMILYLLREIAAFDDTQSKNVAAYARLLRFDLANRLYGPPADPNWAERYAGSHWGGLSAFERTALDAVPEPPGTKSPSQLTDRETRVFFDGRIHLLTLPATDSPLHILQTIEQDYPKSRFVPEAVYRQGAFHQRRGQFEKATRAYRRLIAQFPQHGRAKFAREQIANIEGASVEFGSSGVFPTGTPPKIDFACRGTNAVHFTARRFQLDRYMTASISRGEAVVPGFLRDSLRRYPWTSSGFFSVDDDEPEWKKYVGKEVARWEQSVPKSLRVKKHTATLPLKEPGVYLVEVAGPDKETLSRTLLIVSGIALVTKATPGGKLAWVVDSRTGRPLVGVSVQIHWITSTEHGEVEWHRRKAATDRHGLVRLKPENDAEFLLVDDPRGMAFSTGNSGYLPSYLYEPESSQPRCWSVTDRPLYRPGDTVHFRLWYRRKTGRTFRVPKAGTKLSVVVHDGDYQEYKRLPLQTDAEGTAHGSFRLSPEATLGEYSLAIDDDGVPVPGSAKTFRVEEYKKPEFEVAVKPLGKSHRLGEPLRAEVRARYYFGRPVSGGEVSYQVFRRPWLPPISPPHRFDWLYGNGFGIPLSGLHAFNRPGASPGMAYAADNSNSLMSYLAEIGAFGEPVASGTARLDADGKAEISVPAKAGAKSDRQDRYRGFQDAFSYIITAEVRDESRRTVKGRGMVLVARRQFYAWVEPDRNWYRAGDTARLHITARTANDAPVTTNGEVVLYRLRGDETKTEVGRWKAGTNANGDCVHRVTLRDAGRYRAVFVARDGWKQEVRGAVELWVHGPGWTPDKALLPDVLLLPRRRTYRPGETARVLFLSNHAKTHVLLSNSLNDNSRFLDFEGQTGVIDVPITERHAPNVLLNAVFVKDGHVRTATCELFVPPTRRLLRVKLLPERKAFKPGQTNRLRVEVTDANGRPVAGDLALTAYDKALTYIQNSAQHRPRRLLQNLLADESDLIVDSAFRPDQFHTVAGLSLPEFAVPHDPGLGMLTDDLAGVRWSDAEMRVILRIRQTQRVAGFEVTKSTVVRHNLGGGMGGGIGGGGGGYATIAGLAAPDSFAGSLDDTGSFPLFGVGGKMRELKATMSLDLDVSVSEKRRNAPPELRSDFQDRGLWIPVVKLDENGRGTAELRFPESLTTWQLRGYVITPETRLGDATVEVVTSKDLLVRLQAPRFFVEEDRVTLSANVHNHLRTDKSVTAELIVPAALFQPVEKNQGRVDSEGNLHVQATKTVKAGTQRRFDWPLRIRGEGRAQVIVKALTDEESDAVQMAFPVLPRGIHERQAHSGSIRSGDESIVFQLPGDIDPTKTRLEVALAPSAAAVAIDAIPYLLQYPYGCVEQTMSRFYPLALARHALQRLGTDLEMLDRRRGNRRKRGSPVYDSREAAWMIETGLQRLYRFQHDDGGWGWWQNDDSTPYMTAYVLLGLHTCEKSGVKLRDGVVHSGRRYLYGFYRTRRIPSRNAEDLHTAALAAYVLSLPGPPIQGDHALLQKLLKTLRHFSTELNAYGKTLLALALHNGGSKQTAKTLLQRVLKTAKADERAATMWVPAPKNDRWRWWTNEVEINAWVLRALVKIDPKSDRITLFANWLARNRRGRYWDSTRSTALAIAALAEQVRPGEDQTTVDVHLDGRRVTSLDVSWKDFLAGRHRLHIDGKELKPGEHTVTLVSKGRIGAFYSCTAEFLRKPKRFRPAGTGIAIRRRYFQIDQDGKRRRLTDGARVSIGDLIEVELKISAKDEYEYIAFEDPKPAGCEPVELRSGSRWEDGFFANVELRDRAVAFFADRLPRGRRSVRYRLRCETPGTFHALPARGFAMYAPEIRAHSSEFRFTIAD